MADGPGSIDFPDGYELWPRPVQEQWLQELHALYFPKLRWWQKPETDSEDSGPRPKQLPPDHPRHGDPDNRGYRCGCSHLIPNCPECPPCPGNPDWSIWLNCTGRGCVAGHTLVYLPLEDRHERIDVLAAAGRPVTVLALTEGGPRPAVTEGAPFLKGVADLYEVTTDDGQVITVTDQHRFLTPQGWRRLADVREGQLLAAGAPVPQGAVSAALRASRRDGRRSTGTVPGSPDRYLTYPGSCDPLPLPVSGSGRGSSPSRDGAAGRSPDGPRRGDRGASQGCSPDRPRRSRHARSSSFLAAPSLAGAVALALPGGLVSPHRRSQGSPPSHGTTFPERGVGGVHLPGSGHAWLQTSAPAGVPSSSSPGSRRQPLLAAAGSSGMTGLRPRLDHGELPRRGNDCASHPETAAPPSLVAPYLDSINWTRIRTVRPAGTAVFYDMHVPGPENYAAEGLWNHNTGKTKAGSNWVLEMALSKPGIHVGICAPKYEDVRAVLIEGESGILAEARRNGIEIGPNAYNKNRQEIELDNGSKIRGFSAEKPDSIRGQNLSYCWFDELAMIRYFQFYHEGLMPALRKGDKPRMMITTTPKRVRLIRELLEEAAREDETGVHLTEASSEENIHFSRAQRERLERKYAGTYMLEQELKGRLVGEVDGCLFPIEQFNETRVYPDKDALPQWRRVVVAIDPATTSSDSSDESGICVAAEGADGDFYILEDCSGRYAPDQQMRVVAEAFYRHDADCVVGEVNSTGDYMRALLNTVDPNIPLRTVHGLKGKVARAQGPSSLFMQSRVHMVGDNFTKLEEQLSAFTEGDDRSRMKDDRADACLAEGTLVLTARGEIPIEQVVPGDLAWTRAGWKPVTAARCTQRNAEVLTVLLSDGRELTGTGDHRIWTENRGWQRLDALLWGDILSGWSPPHKSSIKAALTGAIPTALAGTIGSTISAGSRAVSSTCIATSGATRIRARKFRPAGTSTTMMRILSTTIRPIWFSSRRLNIPRFIRATSPGRKRTFSTTSTESALSLPSGIAPTRGMHGMSSMARTAGRTGSGFQPGRARSAGPGSSLTGTGRSGVRNAASSAPATATRSIWRLSPARRATSSSSATSTASDPGRALVSVLGSCASGERRDVYDLTVADVHEFTASGVIVHNCVWALIHLAGSNQGDWGIVYGFRDCTKCGSRVNEDKDQRCGNCGAEVNPLPPKHAGGRPPREPWSVAYLRECPNGHRYTPRERSCPECAPSPETYLAKALSMSAPGGGRFGYTGRDILRGRRI